MLLFFFLFLLLCSNEMVCPFYSYIAFGWYCMIRLYWHWDKHCDRVKHEQNETAFTSEEETRKRERTPHYVCIYAFWPPISNGEITAWNWCNQNETTTTMPTNDKITKRAEKKTGERRENLTIVISMKDDLIVAEAPLARNSMRIQMKMPSLNRNHSIVAQRLVPSFFLLSFSFGCFLAYFFSVVLASLVSFSVFIKWYKQI